MIGIWDLEWANINSQRAYPLADFATKRDKTGSFTLPDSFLLGLYFPVSAGLNVDPARFLLRRVVSYTAGYAVSLGYDDGTDDPPIVATAIVARAAHAEGRGYAMPGTGDFDDSVGTLVVGRLDDVDLQPAGQFDFGYAGGVLDVDCIRPSLRGVSALTLVSGGVRGPRHTGDFELVEGANVRLTASTGGGVVQIRIDAIDGAGLDETCDCAGTRDLPPPIRTINGLPPTPEGDFTLAGDDCLGITPLAAGLQLADRCSKPCCGCAELEALTRELGHLGDEARTLRDYVVGLKAQLDTMEFNVLGSRLNDDTCLTC